MSPKKSASSILKNRSSGTKGVPVAESASSASEHSEGDEELLEYDSQAELYSGAEAGSDENSQGDESDQDRRSKSSSMKSSSSSSSSPLSVPTGSPKLGSAAASSTPLTPTTGFVRNTTYGFEATAQHIQRSRRFKRFHLIRSFALSDFITLGNAACGTCSIFFCLNFLENAKFEPYLLGAFVLLPLALIFDILDGSVARWRKRSSPYGMDLDSLADVVSFSVAPAVLGFTLGLRGLFDSALLSFYVCCGISRLARYNVTAPFLSQAGKVKYYEGFPVPTSLMIVFAWGILYRMNLCFDKLPGGNYRLFDLGHFHPLSLVYFVFGCLMISEVKVPKP